MTKGVVTSVLALVFFASTFSFSSIKKSLIDFTTFEKNMSIVVEKDKKIHADTTNTKPEIDFTQYGYPAVDFTIDDWKLDKWNVILTSSANTIRNNVLSYTKKVASKQYGDVLGARIHFIEGRFLSWALIMPPYEFYPYYDNGKYVNTAEGGGENSLTMGVLVNVGQIKSVSTWVYGLNYKHQIGVRTKDRDDVIHEYFMGSTYFDGWRKLVWMNPEYTDNIQDRVLQRLPLYPKSYPYIKFDSFAVYKPETEQGGDYIVYFKDVEVEFDRAIVREELDIQDEDWWGILAKERLDKKVGDLKQIGERRYLQKQEENRQKARSSQAGTTK